MVLIYKCIEDNGEVLRTPEIRVSQIQEIRFYDYGKSDENKYKLFTIISEEIVRKSDSCNEQNKMFVVRKYVCCDCNKVVMEEILKLIDRVDELSGYNNGNGTDDIVINLNATDYADLGFGALAPSRIGSDSDELDNFDRFGGDKGIECVCGYDVRELDVCGKVL